LKEKAKMPHWAGEQIRVLIEPNSQIVMFITVAIDFLVQPKDQSAIKSNRIRRACHAVALDDERRAFWPALWEEDVVDTDAGVRPILENWSPPADAGPLPVIDQQRLSQVWFTGMHSDVGGGYPQDGLSHVTLDWMMSRALVYGLLLKPAETAELRRRANENDKLNDSRHGLGGYYRYQPRKVGTLCGDPVKPDIFHDRHYLWRTLKNLGAHDPQSDVDNGLRASSVYSPMIYQSVFNRIIKGVDGYSPIVLPANYRVVSRNGDVVSERYESTSQAEERARRQERVWNWVWGRRVVYFLTVFVSLALVAPPILLLRWPGNCEPSFAALLIPAIDLIAKFLPSITSYWTDAFKEAPTWVLLSGIALAGLLFLGGRLQRRIFDRMRPLWNANLGAPPHAVPECPLPNDGIYRIRSLMVYRGFFYSLTHWMLLSHTSAPVVAKIRDRSVR
jgi:hypothetical protein